MKRSVIMFMISAVAFLLLANIQARAADIIVAKSCEQKDVQEAIEQAKEDDIVQVPSGTCTWTSPAAHEPTVTILRKAITLRGAGIGKTIVQDATGSEWGERALWVEGVEGKPFRITGFTFAGVGQTAGTIDIRGSSKNWQIDHCRFADIKSPVFILGYTYGVISHCEFFAYRPRPEDVYGSIAVGNENASWERPLSLGTAEAVYVEDSLFDYEWFGNVMDANTGGRYVFRYNQVRNSYVECHAFRQLDGRGTFSVEIYGNTFIADNESATYAVMGLRGGTGVVYDNTATGVYNVGILVDNQRSCIVFDSGLCDGTNPLDGNEPGGQGYPCRDQIGRSTDSGLNTPQAYEPMYEWNNTFNGGDMDIRLNPAMCPLTAVHIKENRDYYNDKPRPGYTPYAYPHLLSVQSETGRLLNLHKTVSSGQVNLKWGAVSGATGYGVSRDWEVVIPVSNTTYTDTNQAQVYIVYAYDFPGKIIAAEGVNTDDQAPSAPQNLHAPAVTSYSVTLAWDASTDNFGVIGYRIYQDNNTTPVANTSGVTTATVFNLKPSTDYSFTVTAYDAGGNETKSGPVNVTTKAGFTISGKVTLNGVGLADVFMSGLPGVIRTNAGGDYTTTVDENWSGTVTPTLSGYAFAPASIDYSSGVTANQVDQNYTATASGGGSGDSGGGGGGCFIAAVQGLYLWFMVLGLLLSWLVWVYGRGKSLERHPDAA